MIIQRTINYLEYSLYFVFLSEHKYFILLDKKKIQWTRGDGLVWTGTGWMILSAQVFADPDYLYLRKSPQIMFMLLVHSWFV